MSKYLICSTGWPLSTTTFTRVRLGVVLLVGSVPQPLALISKEKGSDRSWGAEVMLPVTSPFPNFTLPPAGNTFVRSGKSSIADTYAGKESTSLFPGPL